MAGSNRDDTVTPPPVDEAVESALVSERLRRLEEAETEEREAQTEHLEISRETRDAVKVLVELGERKEQRELAALAAEQKRLEASAEAEHQRVSAEITERQARGAWLREQAGRLVVPIVGILTALGGAVSAWAAGLFGGGGHR